MLGGVPIRRAVSHAKAPSADWPAGLKQRACNGEMPRDRGRAAARGRQEPVTETAWTSRSSEIDELIVIPEVMNRTNQPLLAGTAETVTVSEGVV